MDDRIYNQLDRIEDKLDSHLERLSKAEEAIIWMKGHVKISITILVTICGFLTTYLLNTL